MATYTVKSPDGRTVKLTGDSEPTEKELEDVFSKLPKEEQKQSEEEPKQAKPSLLEKGVEIFKALSKSIPLGDRIKEAALVGRGAQAIDNKISAGDIPHILAKTAAGAVPYAPGALEFLADRPIAGPMEAAPKAMGITKSPNLFPKAVTEEGAKLGTESEIASSLLAATLPIGEMSVAERITKDAAKKSKQAKIAISNATENIVKFDSKVRAELLGTRVRAGNEFGKSLEALQASQPKQVVDLTSAVKGLGVEINEAGELVASNPKLLSDVRNVLGRSGNKTLQKVIQSPELAQNMTLEESQQVIQSIKKIPSLASKLKQGKFAQYSDTDIPILQFIEDVRDAQLSAFPEFSKTLGAYRETMHKFRAIMPYFKESNLITNISSDFGGKPVIKQFVKELLPKEIVGEMNSVRKVRGAIQASKIAAKTAAITAVGGGVAGGAFAVGRALLD